MWISTVSHHLQCWQLLWAPAKVHSQSSSLQMHLGNQQKMLQLPEPVSHTGDADGVPSSRLSEMNQQMEPCSLPLSLPAFRANKQIFFISFTNTWLTVLSFILQQGAKHRPPSTKPPSASYFTKSIQDFLIQTTSTTLHECLRQGSLSKSSSTKP